MYWFATEVNSGNNSINGKLMADIVVNENVLNADGTLNGDGSNLRGWTPMEIYKGIFEGNGNTLSGIYGEYGLFKNLQGDEGTGYLAAVQSLGILDSYISGPGAIASEASCAKLINCYNAGTVMGSAYFAGGLVGYAASAVDLEGCYNIGIMKGEHYVGGVVGVYVRFGNLIDCYNAGTVIGTGEYVGGIAGSVYNDVTGCYNAGVVQGQSYVGGIAGGLNYMNMTDCYNIGTVTATSGSVGGVLGWNYYATLSNCYNTGDVGGLLKQTDWVGGVMGYNTGCVYDCWNSGKVVGSEHIGGIVGRNVEKVAVIERSYNTGDVIGWRCVGGIAGYNKGSVANSYNWGTIAGLQFDEKMSYTIGGVIGSNYNGGRVDSCYNAGAVSGTWYAVGSVIGYNSGATVTNCYYLLDCAVDGNSQIQLGMGYSDEEEPVADVPGAAEVKTAKQFASGEVACLLQNDQQVQIWGQKIGEDSYPVFSEHEVYCVTDEQGNFLGYSNVEGELPGLGATISGNVTSYIDDSDVTVELLQAGEVVYTASVNGMEYAFESVATGTYILRFSKNNHITSENEIVVGDGDMTINATLCPIGDVTGDGVVNIKDFQRLLRHVNKTNPLTDYELACGDVTGDGVCNIKDFQRLLRHVNKTNPLF